MTPRVLGVWQLYYLVYATSGAAQVGGRISARDPKGNMHRLRILSRCGPWLTCLFISSPPLAPDCPVVTTIEEVEYAEWPGSAMFFAYDCIGARAVKRGRGGYPIRGTSIPQNAPSARCSLRFLSNAVCPPDGLVACHGIVVPEASPLSLPELAGKVAAGGGYVRDEPPAELRAA